MGVPLSSRAALLIAATLASSTALAQEAVEPSAPTSSAATQPQPAQPPSNGTAPATQTEPSTATFPTKYVVVAGLGTAAIATFFVSALFDSLAGNAYNDGTTLAQQRACGSGPSCSAFDSKHDTDHDDRVVSGVFLGVGSVTTVAAIAAFFLWPTDDEKKHDPSPGSVGSEPNKSSASSSSPWFAPSVGPHGASLTAGVRF